MEENTDIKQLQGEILEEFEVEGKSARIIRPQLQDIDKQDLEEHARNLAETNFKLLENVPNAEKRATVRQKINSIREKLGKLPIIGKSVKNSKLLDKAMDRVYPDYTKEEHFQGYRDKSFPLLIENKEILAVEMDGRIVAIQGFRHIGQTSSGRPVYEFTKASTLDSYKGKKLNPRLKKTVFEEVMKKHPDAMWVGVSVNKDHLKKFEENGWHKVEMNDANKAVQLSYQQNPIYCETMIKQGYKAVYLDPKTDQVKWV